MRFARCLALLLAAVPLLAVASPPSSEETARTVVEETLRRARTSRARASALAALAWPASEADPQVAEHARASLLGYRDDALSAMRSTFLDATPDQQPDIARAMLQVFKRHPGGLPPNYLPGLEEIAWFGTREARFIVIPELARHRYWPAVLTIIDTAHEYPELKDVCIRALGRMGDERARFFLEKELNENEVAAESAALALARIGRRALFPLKAAARGQNRAARLAAVRALLPVATPDDVSTLHEYVALYPDDDPALTAVVRESAVQLEQMLRASEAAAAASSEPEP